MKDKNRCDGLSQSRQSVSANADSCVPIYEKHEWS